MTLWLIIPSTKFTYFWKLIFNYNYHFYLVIFLLTLGKNHRLAGDSALEQGRSNGSNKQCNKNNATHFPQPTIGASNYQILLSFCFSTITTCATYPRDYVLLPLTTTNFLHSRSGKMTTSFGNGWRSRVRDFVLRGARSLCALSPLPSHRGQSCLPLALSVGAQCRASDVRRAAQWGQIEKNGQNYCFTSKNH